MLDSQRQIETITMTKLSDHYTYQKFPTKQELAPETYLQIESLPKQAQILEIHFGEYGKIILPMPEAKKLLFEPGTKSAKGFYKTADGALVVPSGG